MLLDIWTRAPVILVHMIAAFAALLLGIVMLTRRKGDTGHRTLGWAWVALMTGVVVSSAFIRDYRMPNVIGFTPIHAFTLLVATMLPLAIFAIRRGNVVLHRRAMRGIYIGGCIVAGIFTLVPGRFLGNLLWKQALGLVA